MWRNRLALIGVLIFVATGLTACYRDAGENVQPTSNQVNLTDIAPLPPTFTLTPTQAAPVTEPTRTPIPTVPTLVPTTTPPGSADQANAVATEPSAPTQAQPTDAPLVAPQANPTDAPTIQPSFTPAITATWTPSGPIIETPGMSDIQPSSTPPPTIDPTNMPTPTPIPVEENPCIHVVIPNDTLYSIAQNNSVLLGDLVAANTDLLWAGAETPLQIGWQLDIPGCSTGQETSTPTSEAGDAATPVPSGEQTIHVVSSGETIFSIGRLYGVDPYEIIEINGLVNPDVLQPGQELLIPATAP